jgi:cytochrome c553
MREDSMKTFAAIFAFALFPVAAFAADATQDWAFLTPGPDAPAPTPPPARPEGAPAAAPQAGVPAIVAMGKGAEVRPCNTCHTPSGMGQPESANLRGLPAAYFVEQMNDFKSGARKGPRAGAMSGFAKNMTDDDIKEVAAYYSSLKPESWTIVNETDIAPKTIINKLSQRLRVADGGAESVGPRIVEFAQNPAQVRNAQTNAFIAFAPTGSLSRGQALVTTGANGVTTACGTCHGQNLQGMGDVPGIAGRSPVYISRQLYTFKDNDRNGANADLMKAVVAKLTNDDVVAIGAYVGSRSPS